MDVQTYKKTRRILDEEYSVDEYNINYKTKPNRPSIHVSNHLVIFNESREPEIKEDFTEISSFSVNVLREKNTVSLVLCWKFFSDRD